MSSEPSNTISEDAFHELMTRQARNLLRLAGYIAREAADADALTRPLLTRTFGEAAILQEILDAYSARNSRRWRPFRYTVAALKRFTDLSHTLMHAHQAIPSYRLLPVGGDFTAETAEATVFCTDIVRAAARRLVALAQELHLAVPMHVAAADRYTEQLPPGQLPRDRTTRLAGNVGETVSQLATAFLRLAAESKLLHAPGKAGPQRYAECIPDPISESSLRELQHRFHNMQSLYDTHVSQTRTEKLDADLPVLRGHVSIIFHLLEAATSFCHYYERHLSYDDPERGDPIVPVDRLLDVLMNYSLGYASAYLSAASDLCRRMLGRYVEVTTTEVPVPCYRGFHVRPSTLVAKIVLHYGSEVTMLLDAETYNAGSPLELFRANEAINAQKRRRLAEHIGRLPPTRQSPGADLEAAVRHAVLTLAERGKIIIYAQPLPFRETPADPAATLLERIAAEVAHLQATGKIDIHIDLTVTFRGDRRVLEDLKLLAETGYGEDRFGNNIPLPEPLEYLRK